ncbi:hypothetical protein EGH24_07375 [Halonotius terrestris]|uniref:Pyrrolo-quinoline quinone repeat domain-containing protein n=1 Tax=Halonotius terrestris TaxID=2487750 RepID=A0A8J8PBV2_9EURY|nr:PQQ-binding-like beta-propeller repeat protein [Halonotius terrestris]TQQ80968.1 hypothetical protein EGH24_07375 [Halonotius terrestris]
MTDDRSETTGHGPLVSRRTALRTTAAVGFAATVGVTPAAAQSSSGDVEWDFSTGGTVNSSPTIVDSFVYVGSDDGSVYSLNASNAYGRWKFGTDGPVRSSPLVVDGIVFVGSNDNNLYAIDAESGEEEWSFETGGSIVSSPVVVDKTAFVGSRDGKVYAIDAESGRQSWTYETGGQVDGSPVVVNGTVFIGSYDNMLYALDAESGEEVWTFETGGEIQTSPTVANEMVYVSSEDANVYAVDIESGEEQWSEGLYRNGGLTAPTVAEGAYSRDTLFVADTVRVHGLNAAVGGSRWSTRFDGSDPVAPTVMNDHVFAGDDNTVALDAENGEKLWETSDGITSAPTGADDTVFLGSDDTVYSLISGTGGSSEDSRVTLGTLGHHDGWQYADQTLEIDTSPPEPEQEETTESDDGNETDTDGNETADQSDDEETESAETGSNAPGFGISTTVAALSGASYVLKRRFGADTDNQ